MIKLYKINNHLHKTMENMEKKESILEAAKRNFEAWNNALQTKNPAEVAKLYRDDCVFLPTFPEEGQEVVGKNGVENYFKHFLTKNPFGVIMEEKVSKLGDDSYSYAGLYNFLVGPEDNRSTARAKFTYIYKKDEAGNWGILLHNSSPLNK